MQQSWFGQAKPVMGVGKAALLPCSKGNMHELVNAVFLALQSSLNCRWYVLYSPNAKRSVNHKHVQRKTTRRWFCNRPPNISSSACAAMLDAEGTEVYRQYWICSTPVSHQANPPQVVNEQC